METPFNPNFTVLLPIIFKSYGFFQLFLSCSSNWSWGAEMMFFGATAFLNETHFDVKQNAREMEAYFPFTV